MGEGQGIKGGILSFSCSVLKRCWYHHCYRELGCVRIRIRYSRLGCLFTDGRVRAWSHKEQAVCVGGVLWPLTQVAAVALPGWDVAWQDLVQPREVGAEVQTEFLEVIFQGRHCISIINYCQINRSDLFTTVNKNYFLLYQMPHF